jgi:CheY-like chemotaxis protein
MDEKFNPSNYTVLIVDDEVALADIICEEFKEDGYNVLTAYNGTQGMELLKEHKVDLVLTDLIMPETSGLELIEFAKKNFPSIKHYFVMTGFIDHSKTEILEMGVKQYFTKPVLMEDVLDLAKKHLLKTID